MSEWIVTVEPGTAGRVDVNRAARILGVQEHDIPTLVRARLLKPLGNPVPCAPKYFATCELVKLANDAVWLDKVTRAISVFWKQKNARRSSPRRSPQA